MELSDLVGKNYLISVKKKKKKKRVLGLIYISTQIGQGQIEGEKKKIERKNGRQKEKEI